MSAPSCTNNNYFNFKLKKKDCLKYHIFSRFTDIPLKDWANVPSLVKADTTSVTAIASVQQYINALEKISTQLVKHPYVQDFAGRAKKYLKLKRVQDLYQEEFEKEKEKKEHRASKRKLNYQTQLISESETLLKGVKKLKSLNEKIAAEQQESSSSSSNNNVQCLIDSNTSSSSSNVNESTKSIKETLYVCGEEIHERYKQGKALTGDELKAMKCGLSCILDLSEARESITRSLFQANDWSRIINTSKKFIIKVPKLEKSLQEKWEVITTLVMSENRISNAEKYISLLRSKSSISAENQHLLDFFSHILYLVDANQFILDPSNYAKVSERDFAYQIWLPLLKKLFHINNDLVRIKVGETVLSDSTNSKADLYPNHNRIIGFKVDIRVIFDFKQEELDIVCGEACISLAGENKIEHDKSKLLREGKIMQTALQNIIIAPKESIISWMLQLSGPTCSFSTLHNTKHNEYHVNVPQFTATFPSSYSQLGGFLSVIENLFMFRNSVEKIAHRLNNSIRTRLDRQQEYSLQDALGSPERPLPTTFTTPPLYFTPPRKEKGKSVAPVYTHSSNEDSEGSLTDDEIDDETDGEPDQFGFVLCRSGLYKNIVSNQVYQSHPYQM